MADVNKWIIVGRLGSDPELKKAGDKSVCEFSVASTEHWINKAGEKQESTEWTRVVVWGKRGENCAKYLKKGREVYVEGRAKTRDWEKDGVKHYKTELVASDVQFLGGKDKESSGQDYPTRDDDSAF